MNYLPFNPTKKQRANLERLAVHLDLGVTNLEFDMSEYQSECGTIGCAAGHGPSLGISKHRSEDWDEYTYRAFGVYGPASKWMFFGLWSKTDNTPRGAAARIRIALRHGIPENYPKQIFGRGPLSYTVSDLSEKDIKHEVTA